MGEAKMSWVLKETHLDNKGWDASVYITTHTREKDVPLSSSDRKKAMRFEFKDSALAYRTEHRLIKAFKPVNLVPKKSDEKWVLKNKDNYYCTREGDLVRTQKYAQTYSSKNSAEIDREDSLYPEDWRLVKLVPKRAGVWVLRQKLFKTAYYLVDRVEAMCNQSEARRFSSRKEALECRENAGTWFKRYKPVKLVPKKTKRQYIITYDDGVNMWYVNEHGMSATSENQARVFATREEAKEYKRDHFLSEYKVVKLSPKKTKTPEEKWVLHNSTILNGEVINYYVPEKITNEPVYGTTNGARIFNSQAEAEHFVEHNGHGWGTCKPVKLASAPNDKEYQRGYNDALNEVKEQINKMEAK